LVASDIQRSGVWRWVDPSNQSLIIDWPAPEKYGIRSEGRANPAGTLAAMPASNCAPVATAIGPQLDFKDNVPQ